MKKTTRGFTLVELLVTISILAILSVVGLTIYSTVQSKARDAKRVGDVNSISKALEVHYNEVGDSMYPIPSVGWFDSGFPLDPKNNSTYFYSWKGKASDGTVTGGTSDTSRPTAVSVSFTICTKLENSTGNATAGITTTTDPVTGVVTTTNDTTAGDGTTFTTASGNGTHYCKKNLQ